MEDTLNNPDQKAVGKYWLDPSTNKGKAESKRSESKVILIFVRNLWSLSRSTWLRRVDDRHTTVLNIELPKYSTNTCNTDISDTIHLLRFIKSSRRNIVACRSGNGGPIHYFSLFFINGFI